MPRNRNRKSKEQGSVISTLAGDSASMRRAAKEMSKEMTKQTALVTKRNGASVAKGTRGYSPKKAEKGRQNNVKRMIEEDQLVNRKRISPPSAKQLNSRLDLYFKTLQDPWTNQGIRCPVNYNPVPSFLITPAHTTRTVPVLTVASGTTTQLTLFPGHSFNIDTDAMDGVSYHSGLTQVNGTNYPVGPLTVSAAPIIGAETSGLAGNVDVNNLNSLASTPMTYDVNLPYSAATGNGGHSRWKLVSMGIVIENTTPIQTRGGTVQHVMPASNIYATGVLASDYNSQPTFRITTEANDGELKLSWIPRADDLAYWHVDATATPPATIASVINAGVIVWITAPGTLGGAFSQTYSYQVVCNWELSGHSLAAVSSPTIHQPSDKNIIEPVISGLQFTQSHATNVVKIARTVAANAPAFVEHVARAGSLLSELFA